MKAGAWVLGILGDVGSLFPSPPSWIGDLPGYVSTAAGYVASTGYWVPWTVAVAVLGSWVLCLNAALLVKVARITWSFVPFVGGDAS
jgi:hypothetical protein